MCLGSSNEGQLTPLIFEWQWEKYVKLLLPVTWDATELCQGHRRLASFTKLLGHQSKATGMIQVRFI